MVKWGEVELPGFDAPLVSVAAGRREELAAHVRELIVDLKTPARAARKAGPAPPGEVSEVATACSLCRGFCCRTGGNEAYLNPKTLARVWSEQAHLAVDDLVAAYLDAVPEFAFAGSCIFHTERGCNLPRALRSNVCHTYECTPLRKGLSAGAGEQG
jgi:hypothetical protein